MSIHIVKYLFNNFFFEKLNYLDNILVGVKVVFLPDYLLVLSLLKHMGISAFFNLKKKKNKKEDLKQEKPFKYVV